MITNPMQNKTTEERKAIAAKGAATRRANIEANRLAKQAAIARADKLQMKIAELEKRLGALQRFEAMSLASAKLTGTALLREEEIVELSLPWSNASGVYFLINGGRVVYAGQAVNVYSRIGQHTDKKFSHYAFVSCPIDALNKLESLYIHCLRPALNGDLVNGAKCAPIRLTDLFGD